MKQNKECNKSTTMLKIAKERISIEFKDLLKIFVEIFFCLLPFLIVNANPKSK